jgi:hypothetical protein
LSVCMLKGLRGSSRLQELPYGFCGGLIELDTDTAGVDFLIGGGVNTGNIAGASVLPTALQACCLDTSTAAVTWLTRSCHSRVDLLVACYAAFFCTCDMNGIIFRSR